MNMRNANNRRTAEDYLEAILIIKERQGYVRSIDVADQLGVTKPSVTYVTKRLKETGEITTDHAGMLVLTESGQKIANATYEKHQKLTRFLEMLGVDEKIASRDACLMEHDMSAETFEALCRHMDKMK